MVRTILSEIDAAAQVSIAWIGLLGVIVTAVIAPLIFSQLKRLQDRNDRQHREAQIARDAHNADRHADHEALMLRLGRLEEDVRATREEAVLARRETSEISRLFVEHTMDEVDRYGAIQLAIGAIGGPHVVVNAERAVGMHLDKPVVHIDEQGNDDEHTD